MAKMWYKKVNLIFIILVFWLATVKGSCLEYGHSCWGAHGKRSGGKVFRPGTDITNAEIAFLPDGSNENHIVGDGADAAAHSKSFYETLQDAVDSNALPLSGGKANDEEILTPSNKQIQDSQLRDILLKRNLYRKRHSGSLLDTESAELPELNNRLNNQAAVTVERWRRVPPILKLKNFNNPLLTGDRTDRERRQQEARKKSISWTTDDGSSYFDYK